MASLLAGNNRWHGALAFAALVVIGTIGPWATVFSISVSGTDTDDGKLVLGIGIAALVVAGLARIAKFGARPARVVLAILGLLTGAISVYDASDLSGTGVSLGWGLILDIIAGFALAAVALIPAPATSPAEASPAAGSAAASSAVAASWAPDPAGRHQLRYWDGTRWTEHVSDSGVAGVDPL